MSLGFVARNACPACDSKAAQTLYKTGFNEAPLGLFLREYYLQPIPAGTYQLDRCLS